MNPKPVTENIWECRTSISQGGVNFPVRATLIRIGEDLLVISPVPLDDELALAVDDLGRLQWILAPSLFHHLSVTSWAKRWPEALVMAPGGLRKKRKKLKIDHVLEEADPPSAWAGHVEVHRVQGVPSLDEHVVFHPPSKTLVVTDLCFHLDHFDGLMAKLFFTTFGVKTKQVCQSRIWKFITKDRPQAAASVEKLLAWMRTPRNVIAS